MDKELETLVTKYKKTVQELAEINHKARKVNSSEQVIANHRSVSTSTASSASSLSVASVSSAAVPTTSPTSTATEDATEKRLDQIISKLKIDVENALTKRLAEEQSAKSVVQSYIDKQVWALFSRTELQNNALLFNNDQKRVEDKKRLMKLITTLFEFDRQEQEEANEREQEEKRTEDDNAFMVQLHSWMVHLITIYLRLATISERKKILQLMVSTSNISEWAVPLIHFEGNKMSDADTFFEILEAVFAENTWTWTEDDFLAVLDQLAIDFNYSRMVESVDAEDNPQVVVGFSQKLTDILLGAIKRAVTMKSLAKMLSQTVIQISVLFIDAVADKGWECGEQIDIYLSGMTLAFYDLKETGWFFLPNIPFKALSIEALWNVTTRMLQIKKKEIPHSIKEVLDDHLPNITRFQYELHDNQMQGFFMLNCLTNIATCIPPGVDEIGAINDPESTLSACIVTVISYTLFTVAFVDKDLREIFYKDVRDSLSAICRCHAFVISLLFRWTVEHISIMGKMALYLFHSLKLDSWVILKDDLKLLHKLLSPNTTVQIQLAKYIIQHLNYDYKWNSVDTHISKSQPWHSRKIPFLSYEIHEEIAFILLDACQQFQPLPDTSNENKGAIEMVGTAVSSYLSISDQIQLLKSAYNPAAESGNTASDFIHWAWSVAIQLKLYDCPVSPRAGDIEQSITLPFLKLVLNSFNPLSSLHSALLIYTSFMLSFTSRHFLRFESSDGWMKLLVILKRGKPEAVIQALSEIVPCFVYMHGDDFFNDESLPDFFRHMVELKSDPMLMKATYGILKQKKRPLDPTLTGVGLIVGSHIWHAHLIDSVSDLMDESGKGFSYVDLVMHSWLKTVFRRSDWMWHSSYVNVVNDLCRLAFTLHRHRLPYHMLIEEHKRMQAVKQQQTTSSPRLTRFIKNMVVPEGAYATLLVGEWSILKTNTFNRSPGVEQQFHWFAFEVLVMETVAETPYREEMAQLIAKQLSTSLASDQDQQKQHRQQQKSSLDLSSIYSKLNDNNKPLEYFSIYRWLQHILIIPVDHPLLPLYMQMFLSLYYQRLEKDVSLGYLFLSKKPEWIAKLRDYVANVQTFHGQNITALNDDTGSPGHASPDAEVLQQFYYAMWLWLGNPDLSSKDIHHLPSHYDAERLLTCYGKSEEEQPWHQSQHYWMDLIDTESLMQSFLSFCWEGADKFRTDNNNNNRMEEEGGARSITEDLISLSTTARRLRLVTDASGIEPMPSIIINQPTPSLSSGSLKKRMSLGK